MLPKARAAAWATSGSESCSFLARAFTAPVSRRTPMLPMTPTSGRPWSLVQGRAEGLIHGRAGDGFQAVAGHVRELLVAQQGRQSGHGFFGADARQLAAGIGLFLFAGRWISGRR